MKFNFHLYILLSLFFTVPFYGQLCTGSLGDPVVNIDFGSGTGRGAALGSAITAYTYSGSGKLDEGYYTIVNTTTGLRDTAWHIVTDHTGGTNGYMMVVNASVLATAGIFYSKTVTNLCPNTTYEFSSWLMNLMTFTSPNPNVTFTVSTTSGTVLGTYNTGSLAVTSSGTWKQFGFYFTTGTVSDVVITMLNNAVGAAPGNDLALDDITFRACGPTVTSVISNEATTNLAVCENESKQITLSGSVSSSTYATAGYQWQTSTNNGTTWTDIAGASSQEYTFTTSGVGTYKYRLATAESSNISSSNCRVFSNEITITVKASPAVAIVELTQPTCDVPSGTITIISPLNGSYSIDGVTFQTSPVFSGLPGGDYSVTTKSGTCAGAVKSAHINAVASSNATPTATVIQPVICTNPYGTITITSSDAEYSFDDGVTWQTSPVKSGLLIGDYVVKTRNSSLCETTGLLVRVEVPPGYPPTPAFTVVQPDCMTATGSITITDAAASYSFDNGQTWGTSSTMSNLLAGVTYKLVIKNALGCSSLVANDVSIYNFTNNEPLPTAPSPQFFCYQENKTLADVAISGSNIKWYSGATGGVPLPQSTVLMTTTYYASQTATSCESNRIPISINVQNTAAPSGATRQDFCSTQNGTVAFLVASGTNVVWFDSASGGTVLGSDTPLVDGQTYYASQTTNLCESSSRLAVMVSVTTPSLVLNDVIDYYCDDLNDGQESVDLTSYSTRITADPTVIVQYYKTIAAAKNQDVSEAVVPASSYSLTLGTTILYARVDSNDKCYQIAKVTLTLFAVPVIPIQDQVALCENTSSYIDAGSGFDTYLWSTAETTQAITVTNLGDYWVTVTQNHGAITCSSTHTFTVIPSNVAVIAAIDLVDWTDNQNSITIHLSTASIGVYEYSLDGLNYQESNTFDNLISGEYRVYVRDKNGCGVVTQEVYILNYPKFFTPNGDGYNDTWAIQLGQTEEDLVTSIFDRYGKLLKIFGSAQSWDGRYNGHDLPSDDYWFVVKRANGKVYKGHFAMKR